MDTTTEQIEHEIEHARRDLGKNLQELEYRVKSATDWRVQFDQHPFKVMGLAFAGGLLLSRIVGGPVVRCGR